MTKRGLFLMAGVIAVGLIPSAAQAQAAARIEVPPVPPNLEAPAGHSVYLKGFAIGTQNYICLPAGAGAAWRFVAPQATLFLTFKGSAAQQITTHFLSTNVADGVARPTWQHSLDTSKVWGRALQSSTDGAYVEPGAIPWLLLEAVGTEAGPFGGRLLAQTTFIQRLKTSGGVAPATGCSAATDVGRIALVPYTTDYYFYRAEF